MTFHPVTNPTNTILFVARDAEGITAIYELDLTKAGREGFRWWFGAVRDANPGAALDIVRADPPTCRHCDSPPHVGYDNCLACLNELGGNF